MEKRGLRPAFDKGASFVLTKSDETAQAASPALRPALFQPASAQDGSYTMYNGDWELTFFSYDDGDPNTWEGVVYHYGPDVGEYTYTATVDVRTEQPSVTEEWYYPVDGSDPVSSSDPSYNSDYPYDTYYSYEYTMARQPSKALPGLSFRNVSFAPGRMLDRPLPSCVRTHTCPPPGSMGTGPWIRCTLAGCTTAAVACALSGPGWPSCFGAWCAGSGAGCIIVAMS
jgi:hypothetical protein